MLSTHHITLENLVNSFQNPIWSHWGWTQLNKPLSISFYESWIKNQFHGDMTYLENHLDFKKNQDKIPSNNPFKSTSRSENDRFFKSALVFAFPYRPHPFPQTQMQSLKIAEYVGQKDYHHWIPETLGRLKNQLEEKWPHEAFYIATDSAPLLERELAARAGIGWIGKNTCLINKKKGSFFLIGELLTTLDSNNLDSLHPDLCGRCRKCIDSCPTQALLDNRSLDANKCISYLTIESKKTPPLELRNKMDGWFFGCDICQDVCPWNGKVSDFFAYKKSQPLIDNRNQLINDLRWILTSSGKILTKNLLNSPLSRARPFGLKRNAIIVACHHQLKELLPDLFALQKEEKYKELCTWAIHQITSNQSN